MSDSHSRYSTEVDVDFVRKAVRAIGRCAIKVESAAERCVSTLVELIQTKVTYVVQEAVVVIKDIFRKYPNQYESIISTLCENLDSLDEPEARYDNAKGIDIVHVHVVNINFFISCCVPLAACNIENVEVAWDETNIILA